MKRLHVTQVLWTLGRAGAERVVLDLSRELLRRNIDVRVVAAGGGGEMQPDFEKAGIALVIGPETRDRRATLRFLREEARAHRPDVWHTHLGGDIWGGWIARRERLHPWIITAHNDDRNDPWLLHQERRWAFRRADHVACVSDVVRAYVRSEFGVPAKRTSVIRSGTDFTRLMLRGSGSFHDVPRLLTVGRLSDQKDHATLLRALARIKRPWHLDVVGVGPNRESLGRLAESLGILPRVRFLGSAENVPYLLSQADLFLFPSRWEGQGLALLEAVASGVCAIASDLPVFRETFDERAITFAPAGQVSAWADAISSVLLDPTTALTRARHAQQIVQETFTLEQMTKSYLDLYRKWSK